MMDLRALNDRDWLKHSDGCSWEYRKEDGSKECDCGLLGALIATPWLDVARLTRAMQILPPIPDELLNHKAWVESDWLPNARDYALAIAAEYARLAEQSR